MYETLKKLKNRISKEKFIEMCDAALEKNKITQEEYNELITFED